MKFIVLSLTLLFTSLFCNTQKTENGITITVTINNVKNNDGKVLLSLHTEETFRKKTAIVSQTATIINGKVIVSFTDVKPGTYAILALHDENNNQKMDYDGRMPKESFGASNNDMSFGPPEFDSAKFDVSNRDVELDIRF